MTTHNNVNSKLLDISIRFWDSHKFVSGSEQSNKIFKYLKNFEVNIQ